jgi:DNA replication protein DnaC
MSKIDYSTSGVPLRHRSFIPGTDSTSEQWSAVYDKIKGVIEKGALVAVVGSRGTGKTQLAAALIGYTALKIDKSCMYKKAFDMFLRIREAMKTTGDSERAAIEEFIKPYLLVIDAYEVRSDSDFENRMLDHIIDKRYDNLKTTIIISNDTVQNFEKTIGVSICDRIRETGGIIEMVWGSFRNK